MVRVLGLVGLLLVTGCATGNVDVVKRQFAAFNAQDVEALGLNVTQDFVWYDVDEGRVKTMVTGRNALEQDMRGYYEGAPKFETKAMAMCGHGNYVAVMERMTYETDDGAERSQDAMSVYLIRDGKIARVWYFPSEKVE